METIIDSMGNQALKDYLLITDAHFAEIVHRHAEYESRLHELAERRYLVPDEEKEEKILKKKKLMLKDEMEEIITRYHVL